VATQALAGAGANAVQPLVSRVRALQAALDDTARSTKEEASQQPLTLTQQDELFDSLANCATALGEAAAADAPPGSIESPVDALIGAVRALQRVMPRTLAAAGAGVATAAEETSLAFNPFGRQDCEGALACCIVALDHLGQSAVASGTLGPCAASLDALMPLALAGAGDMLRGEQDIGRAQSRRACVLATEAVRNLCHFSSPNTQDGAAGGAAGSAVAAESRNALLEQRPLLGEELLSLARSHTTSDRLRGAAMEAVAALTSCSAGTAAVGLELGLDAPSSSAGKVRRVASDTARRLVEARWVTDGRGL